jgi:hypothetical protein
VRDVMASRARKSGKSLEEVATSPYQFSAYSRPDLEQFYYRQPLMFQRLAEELVAEANSPEYSPQYNVTHYVTRNLWENRDSPNVPSWVRKMKPVVYVGNHVGLAE